MKKTQCLKGTLLISLILAFFLGCLPLAGTAQNEPAVFAIVEFMKVKPGNETKYLEVEKNIWKPLHQERINQGKITGWILYRVLYTGTQDPYNYATVTLFGGTANLEDPWAGIDPQKVLPDRDMDKDMVETDTSRELVKSHLIMRLDEVYKEGGPGAFKYIEVDYMKVKPGNESSYVEVERNIWKPIHNEFINAGQRVGWSLWSIVFPSGSGNDYQYVTANYFPDFQKIGAADYNAAYAKAHADKSVEELDSKTANSRDLVRSELWQVVDMVMKQ